MTRPSTNPGGPAAERAVRAADDGGAGGHHDLHRGGRPLLADGALLLLRGVLLHLRRHPAPAGIQFNTFFDLIYGRKSDSQHFFLVWNTGSYPVKTQPKELNLLNCAPGVWLPAQRLHLLHHHPLHVPLPHDLLRLQPQRRLLGHQGSNSIMRSLQ